MRGRLRYYIGVYVHEVFGFKPHRSLGCSRDFDECCCCYGSLSDGLSCVDGADRGQDDPTVCQATQISPTSGHQDSCCPVADLNPGLKRQFRKSFREGVR